MSLLSCRATRASAFYLIYLLIIGISAGISGCSTVAPPAVMPEPPTRPWESAELIQSMVQRREQFRSLRSLAHIDYAGPEGKGSFQEAILVQRPDRLRLETLTFLGAILIVTVDDKEIIGYHPREGVFVRGQRSKENLLRYTQIPLELDEITALLLGLPPVNPRAPSQQNGNSVTFTSSGGRKDLVRFDNRDAVPTRWERAGGTGQIEISAQFTDYAKTPVGLFPTKIVVESAGQNKRLEIRFEEPELNVTIPADQFTQQKPLNVQEVPLEAMGG